MQCLIVAAGKGLRLRERGNSKPLIEIGGQPLIAHVIERAAIGGVRDFVVVTGYEAETLEVFLKNFAENRSLSIAFVRNPEYEKPNGLSVLAARKKLAEVFLLAMCDHLMDPGMVKIMRGLDLGQAGAILGVDRGLENRFVDPEDVTRVKTEGNKIRAIGKGLEDYDAFDTGIFLASGLLLKAIEDSGRAGDWSISGGMMQLAQNDRAFVHDLTGHTWIDVDSPKMYRLAERYLAGT